MYGLVITLCVALDIPSLLVENVLNLIDYRSILALKIVNTVMVMMMAAGEGCSYLGGDSDLSIPLLLLVRTRLYLKCIMS